LYKIHKPHINVKKSEIVTVGKLHARIS